MGFITGIGLYEIGHNVINVDMDLDRITRLQNGESSIYEAGLETALIKSLATGLISFSEDLHTPIGASKIIFIAVGTSLWEMDRPIYQMSFRSPRKWSGTSTTATI